MQVPFAEIVVGSDGALRRIDPILATGARTAFVMLGINDIRRHFPDAITFTNFRRLIDALRTVGLKADMTPQNVCY